MAELHALELRERSEEMLRQLGPCFGTTLEFRVDLAAPVVDHVVAAPEDAVVLGESVVVELVRDVAESLTVGPTNVGQLCGCERLGDHAVVVDRNHVMVQPLEQWLERVCCKCNFASAHCAERRAHDDTHAVFVDRDRFGVFVNGDAKRLGCGLETPHKSGWVDNGRAIFAPQATRVGRGVDLAAHCCAVEQLDFLTQRAELLVIVAEFIEVRLAVRRSGDVDDAGALVVAVDVVPLDGGFDLVEVL